jgi:hypothetical protein
VKVTGLLPTCAVHLKFVKIILKRILEIQEQSVVDIKRQGQHSFKKKQNTSTLSVELQSKIAMALDKGE